MASYHIPAHSYGHFFHTMARLSANKDVLKIANDMVIHFDFEQTKCEFKLGYFLLPSYLISSNFQSRSTRARQ